MPEYNYKRYNADEFFINKFIKQTKLYLKGEFICDAKELIIPKLGISTIIPNEFRFINLEDVGSGDPIPHYPYFTNYHKKYYTSKESMERYDEMDYSDFFDGDLCRFQFINMNPGIVSKSVISDMDEINKISCKILYDQYGYKELFDKKPDYYRLQPNAAYTVEEAVEVFNVIKALSTDLFIEAKSGTDPYIQIDSVFEGIEDGIFYTSLYEHPQTKMIFDTDWWEEI